jgi:hypothetical protein
MSYFVQVLKTKEQSFKSISKQSQFLVDNPIILYEKSMGNHNSITRKLFLGVALSLIFFPFAQEAAVAAPDAAARCCNRWRCC